MNDSVELIDLLYTRGRGLHQAGDIIMAPYGCENDISSYRSANTWLTTGMAVTC